MGVEETKRDLLLRRVQIVIAICAGLATIAGSLYALKKNMDKKEEAPIIVQTPPQPNAPVHRDSPVKAALEESAASWIKKNLGSGEAKSNG